MSEIVAAIEMTTGLITRSVTNLKKQGANFLTPPNIQKRIELVKGYWDEVRTLHLKLITTLTADEQKALPYFQLNRFKDAEDAHDEALSGMMELLSAAENSATGSTSNANRISQVTDKQLRLPRLDLPKFAGSYLHWSSFKDQFQSIFTAYSDTSNVQKLQYLKSCLTDEALLLIDNLPVTDANYDAAWTALTERYENQRLIVEEYLKSFISIPNLKSRSAKDLRNLLDCSSNAVVALSNLKIYNESWDPIVVYIVASKLDLQTRTEWEFELKSVVNCPAFAQFESFLAATIRALESSALQKSCSGPQSTATFSKTSKPAPQTFRSHQTSVSNNRCILCNGGHRLFQCENLKKKTVADRMNFIKQNQCCINCLSKGHFLSNCNSTNVCSICKRKHHTLLHKNNASEPSISHSQNRNVNNVNTSHGVNDSDVNAHSICSQLVHKNFPCSVLLPTAIVLIRASNGRFIKCRALLDQGSQATFVSQAITEFLHAKEEKIDARVSAVGGSLTTNITAAVSLDIESMRQHGPTLSVRALVLPRLTSYTPKMLHIQEAWTHLHQLPLADPAPQSQGPVELIIGSDYLGEVLLPEIKKGSSHAPVAQNTIFGWVVFGNYSIDSTSIAVNHLCICSELDQSLRRFWELEDLPAASSLNAEELECEQHFVETHSRGADGRYVVRLPFKSTCKVDLPRSSDIAEKLFLKNESRLLQSSEKFGAYREFMLEYLSKGHMELVPAAFPDDTGCYFSHHPVWRETSSTSKLRVVFNASMLAANRKSLNDFLLVGPKLQADLNSLICNWRSYRFVVCADIEKMFRQIWIDPRDADFQRIFWRANVGSDLETYRLLTVTYGTASAPFLANRVIKQLARDESSRFPDAANILLGQVYVDDVLFGADDLNTAHCLRLEVSELLMAGGFRLRKWASNSSALLADIDPADHGLACDPFLLEDEKLRLLGISWNPRTDSFFFQVSLREIHSFTKRRFLSCILHIFDPLGLISAITVRAKILVQVIWTRRLGWDDALPSDVDKQCLEYYRDLAAVQDIVIPRWTGQHRRSEQIVIHGFADASNVAYAALVYIKVVNSDLDSKVSLLVTKTKVAPLKTICIPRLELCAAQLLAKLICFVQNAMQLPDAPVCCWSDSSVALSWISNPPNRWKTFVANRVSDIQTRLPTATWRHISGKENPADLASRGVHPEKLAHNELWWQGPRWLRESPDKWPSASLEIDDDALSEERVEKAVLAISTEEIWIPFRPVSSWLRLLRITCFCNRFIAHTRRKPAVCSDISLTSDEITESEFFWVRRMQNLFFIDELNALSRGLSIPRRSKLIKLNPFLDATGMLRVGGRLDKSKLLYAQKFPLILPNCELSELLVRRVHLRTLHGGVQLSMYTIRQQYWILGLRTLVKRCISNCVTCTRYRAVPAQQLMGSLPHYRVQPSRPFSHVGIDYAGPFFVRLSRGRGNRAVKVFVSLFVCLSTKAIHLELVDSCSTADFIAALDRFVARRGIPSDIYTDNGTNFVGADRELSDNYKGIMSDPSLKEHFANERLHWHFIPPGAPHFGGSWEAGVKRLKFHLRRVLGNVTPVKDEFQTLLCNVEAWLNSRPIAPLYDDPESLEALTPGHFLIGTSLKALPAPSVLDLADNRLSRWQMVQKLSEQLWKVWNRDYLHSLQQRSAWYMRKNNLKPGDLVLLKHDNLPPAKWELARVEVCHPGSDDLVRVVTIRTSTGTYKRPISKLCVLPIKLDSPVD